MYALKALWLREIKKFLFDRGRMGGALAQPLMFWLILGLGFHQSFRLPQETHISFLAFLFPGMVVLVVLFTAIFSTVSIVEERRTGFLQGALIAPISRFWLVVGNVAGGATLGMMQALAFFCLAPLVGIAFNGWGFLMALLICGLLGLSFGALGFAMAWKVSSTRGYLALMNFFLIPMWLLSGAFFPTSGLPQALHWIFYLNPVSYGLDALRVALYGFPTTPPVQVLLSFFPSLLILCGFTLASIGFATWMVQKPLFNTPD